MHFGDQLFESLQEPLESARRNHPLDDIALSILDPDGLTRHWPWEVLSRDQAPLGLVYGSLTRRANRNTNRLSTSKRSTPLRLLIVVSRPSGIRDVGFRSVASRVLQATSEESIYVELLRPPTFSALHERLVAARSAGTPFDVVHFDGHGDLANTPNGRKGILLFEDALVDGRQMGGLLEETGVGLLVLNACHSGASPLRAPSVSRAASAASAASASLAEEVAGFDAIDVVAMSHAVSVPIAALIMQDLYRCLDRGHSVGAAVRFARRRWQDGFVDRSPNIGFCIIRHFGFPAGSSTLADWPDYAEPSRSDDWTPPHPKMQTVFQADAPFVAADDPILLVERALRSKPIVQLNGLRGSGKTSLLLELGRWLAASRAEVPERIGYVDLGAASDSTEAVRSVESAEAGILLIDHADCIGGDALRKVAPWPTGDTAAFVECLVRKSREGVQILVAASGRIASLDQAERVVMPRLTADDIRALVALVADRQTAADLPEPAVVWATGNPGIVPILIERQKEGAFSDPARTLEALWELAAGRFRATRPPLRELSPLFLTDMTELFQPDVGMPWLLMQFQGQALLSPILWQLATATGLSSLAVNAVLTTHLASLEQSGLVIRIGNEDFLMHPLLPCLMAHPYNEQRLATEGYLRSLARVQGLYAQYVQFLFGGSPFSGDTRSPGHEKSWDLNNLLHAFDCVAGELQVGHMGALSLARRLRERFVELELDEYWDCILQKLQDLFERYPPPPDDGQFNPHTEMDLLLMEEAKRRGDTALAAQYADKARAAAQEAPGPERGAVQTNAYDVQLKTGRMLADTDVNAARAAFEQALEIAGQDPLRRATVQLELTRLLTRMGAPSDLRAARIHGENAFSLFQKLVKSRFAEQRMIVLITMSLSIVYRRLFDGPDPDPGWAKRGEELCRESLRVAENPPERATAWFNLGGWRRSAKDFAQAAAAFLEAANLYEKLGNTTQLGYSLAYRAECLLEREEIVQARLDAVRAVTVLVNEPDAAKNLILLAYDVGERAMSKLTGREPKP
jgi:hypothetical protein